MLKDSKNTQSLGLARFLSVTSLVLIIACNIVLSLLVTDRAQKIMLQKQENFAQLLAENLSNQIYRRYSIPLFTGSRVLSLSDTATPFESLDQVVQSVIRGANVESLRIYNYNSAVSFSLSTSEIGKKNIAPPLLEKVRDDDTPSFEFVSKIPMWRSLFSLSPEPGTFSLHIIYPLNTQNRLISFEGQGPALDILEFSQDITKDYESIIRFQWSIFGAAAVSSLLLFTLLILFIRKAEAALAERVMEKERLEKELHQNEKLASMGRVVSSIAHEIRNPLGIIRSSAELILKRQQKEQKESSAEVLLLQAIFDESCRLSHTITDFLDYARPKVLNPVPVDIGAVIKQALVFLGNSLDERKITLSTSIASSAIINGDKDLIYRAIYNILANSAQAAGEGGHISIKVAEEASSIAINIADSGPGFSGEALERALDPFFTTKEDGTGLGLAIVQSIILSHKGSITLGNGKSEVAGKHGGGEDKSLPGAHVTIILPKAAS